MRIFEGNQQEKATRRGWVATGFGGLLFFAAGAFLTKQYLETLPEGQRAVRLSVFLAVAALMCVFTVVYLWRRAPDIMEPAEPMPKGWFGWIGASLLLNDLIERTVPDLYLIIYGLGGGAAAAATLSPFVFIFIRPWVRQRSSSS